MGPRRQFFFRAGSASVALVLTLLATSLPVTSSATTRGNRAGLTVKAPLVLGAADFLTPNRGWVTVGNTVRHWGDLYATTDAGTTWRRELEFRTGATFDARNASLGTQVQFLNRSVGFLFSAYGAADRAHWVLQRTTDGGRTWSKVGLPHKRFEYVESFSFLNAHRGWLLASGDIGMGQFAGEVFTTTDAGAHWKRLAWTGYNGNNVPIDHGGLGGSMDSIRFTSPKYGWIFGESPTVGPAVDEHTADGGRSWTACGLPHPRNRVFKTKSCGPLAPTVLTKLARRTGSGQVFVTQMSQGAFFGAGGFVPESIIIPQNSHHVAGGFYLYKLNRMGDSWIDPRRLPLEMPLSGNGAGGASAPAADIQSPTDWAFADHSRLVLTANGGRTWTRADAGLSGKLQPDGITYFRGGTTFLWATAWPVNSQYSPAGVLERSRDAGKTWTILHLPTR